MKRQAEGTARRLLGAWERHAKFGCALTGWMAITVGSGSFHELDAYRPGDGSGPVKAEIGCVFPAPDEQASEANEAASTIIAAARALRR